MSYKDDLQHILAKSTSYSSKRVEGQLKEINTRSEKKRLEVSFGTDRVTKDLAFLNTSYHLTPFNAI